jgi:hypothetical protein
MKSNLPGEFVRNFGEGHEPAPLFFKPGDKTVQGGEGPVIFRRAVWVNGEDKIPLRPFIATLPHLEKVFGRQEHPVQERHVVGEKDRDLQDSHSPERLERDSEHGGTEGGRVPLVPEPTKDLKDSFLVGVKGRPEPFHREGGAEFQADLLEALMLEGELFFLLFTVQLSDPYRVGAGVIDDLMSSLEERAEVIQGGYRLFGHGSSGGYGGANPVIF